VCEGEMIFILVPNCFPRRPRTISRLLPSHRQMRSIGA
jgi:hypothetical protein